MRKKDYVAKKDFEKYRLKKELQILRKALLMVCEELAIKNHCVHIPNCYSELDQEECQLIKECHDKYWLLNYYLDKAREERNT
ncbi:MAG: hypothetical protein MJ007_02910 [Paludibacteraceae bacterium]|nr:hypothetical protein [Paludibacteraceae bacterium]